MTPNQNSFTPAFLSRFPRSLSSLSLGTKKKPNEKGIASPTINSQEASGQVPVLNSGASHSRNNSYSSRNSSSSNHKKKHGRTESKSKADNTPPPLPERNNVSRKSLPTSPEEPSTPVNQSRRSDSKVSDLDSSMTSQNKSSSNKQHNVSFPSENNSRKRSKGKAKAHSDPKMSTQAFLQMELRSMSDGSEPPPLPPRQPSLAEPVQTLICGHGSSSVSSGNDINGRCLPNSINTCMHYPLVATCTTVRDNFSAFPLSHRPNIVRQLQQFDKNNVSNELML